jgi:hypothetical protein
MLKRSLWNELHEIVIHHKQTAEHTLKLLKDTKDYLEFQRNNGLSEPYYMERLKILINMGIVYYYSLYEGFTRFFFRKVAVYDLEIPEENFEDWYPEFKHIIRLIKTRYHIYLKKDMFQIIMKLRDARHNIAHGKGNAKSEFEILVICHQELMQYFELIHHTMVRYLNQN